MIHFHTLDFLVLILFGLGLIGIIIWVSLKKEESSSDYFLAGRNATWIAIGASIFASNIGSEHVAGLAGSGASTGMAMAHWEFTGWIILILAWVFVPFYSHSRIFTTPEFLEKRYNTAARSFLSIISLISYVFTKVAVTVYAGGLVIKEVTGIQSMFGIDFFWIGAIGLVVITAIYTVFVEINWLYFMLYLVALSVFVTILVSLLTKKPDQEIIKGLTYSTISEEQKKTTKASWNKWDVIHSVVIVLILIAIYIYFW